MTRARIVTLVLFALAALPLGAVYAQYPQPAGACSITPNQGAVLPNATLTWTVTVLANNGTPVANVPGTVTVATGTATPPVQTFISGSDGKALITLKTGDNPGDITLSVTCDKLQTSTVLKVLPPAIVPKAPDTGFGTSGNDSSFPLLFILTGLALAGVAGATTVAVAKRRS